MEKSNGGHSENCILQYISRASFIYSEFQEVITFELTFRLDIISFEEHYNKYI